MLLQMKCHLNLNVSETESLLELKYHLNFNVTETEKSLKKMSLNHK